MDRGDEESSGLSVTKRVMGILELTSAERTRGSLSIGEGISLMFSLPTK